MESLKKTARWAGFLYLLVVLGGPFVLMYVPGKVIVPGDAGATIARIAAHETLYRTGIAVGIFTELVFVLVVLTLYRLLKGVDQTLAILMVVFIFIDVPLAFLGLTNQVATLAFARGAEFLSVFDQPQRDALATLLLQVDRHGVVISEIFWGLWLLPLGMLVYRSRFLPRFIGVWLFVNGIAYLVMSAVGLFFPQHANLARNIAMPALFGEMVLMLWLIIRGVRVGTQQPGAKAAVA